MDFPLNHLFIIASSINNLCLIGFFCSSLYIIRLFMVLQFWVSTTFHHNIERVSSIQIILFEIILKLLSERLLEFFFPFFILDHVLQVFGLNIGLESTSQSATVQRAPLLTSHQAKVCRRVNVHASYITPVGQLSEWTFALAHVTVERRVEERSEPDSAVLCWAAWPPWHSSVLPQHFTDCVKTRVAWLNQQS